MRKARSTRALRRSLTRCVLLCQIRGAGGSRTHDGGFAIRCLSHLATAPYRLSSSGSNLCAGSPSCREDRSSRPHCRRFYARRRCLSTASESRGTRTPPRLIDYGPTFSLTFVPVLRPARQRKPKNNPHSVAFRPNTTGRLRPPASVGPLGRAPLRDRDSAAARGENTRARRPGYRVADRLGPCSLRRRNDRD